MLKKEIKWIPKEINGDILVGPDKPESVEKDTSGKFDEENDKLINLVLNKKNSIDKKLDYALTAYEEKLKDLRIPYNPKEYPLLEESIKCPRCGNPRASNAITMETIKQKEAFQEKVNSSFENSLGVNEKSVASVGARQQMDYAALMASLALQIMWTVVGYALEYVKIILMPTQSVIGLQALVIITDQLIKEIRASLEGDQKKAERIRDEARNISAYKSNFGSVKIPNNSFSNIYTNCLNHQKYFKQAMETLMPENKLATTYNYREMVKSAKSTSNQMTTMIDLTVPDNYPYKNENGEDVKYKNNGLQFAKAGKEIGLNAKDIFAGDNGFLPLLNRFDNMITDSLLTGLKTWWEDPNTFCCVIVNLLKLEKYGTDFLQLSRVLLEMYKLYLSSDFKNTLKNGKDFIYNLGNKIMSEIMKALSSVASTALGNMEVNLKKFKLTNEYCAPLNIMMDYLYGALGEFKNDLFSMINSFFVSWSSVVDEVELNARRNKKIDEIDFFIYLIEMILSFMQNVNKCNDNYKKYYKEPESKDPFIETINTLNYPNGKVTKFDTNEKISSSKISSSTKNSVSEKDSGVSNEMVKSFLTNQLGYTEQKSNEIVSARETCQCDNVLSDEDIEKIRKITVRK